MINLIHALPLIEGLPAAGDAADIQSLLEHGHVAYFPALEFAIERHEKSLFSGRLSEPRFRNIQLHPWDTSLRHLVCNDQDRLLLQGLLGRFARFARQLVETLLPAYAPHLFPAATGFHPVDVESRPTGMSNDEARLHVDSFPRNPTGGRRLLRVFSNVNPHGAPRVWRLGEPFPSFAAKFHSRLHAPFPLWPECLHALGITKSRRSPYDHLMLQLHDRVKADIEYQRHAPQLDFAFPPGSTWIAFTDQVLHAAMAGQFLLEQTFYLPPQAVRETEESPLQVLENLCGRRLLN